MSQINTRISKPFILVWTARQLITNVAGQTTMQNLKLPSPSSIESLPYDIGQRFFVQPSVVSKQRQQAGIWDDKFSDYDAMEEMENAYTVEGRRALALTACFVARLGRSATPVFVGYATAISALAEANGIKCESGERSEIEHPNTAYLVTPQGRGAPLVRLANQPAPQPDLVSRPLADPIFAATEPRPLRPLVGGPEFATMQEAMAARGLG